MKLFELIDSYKFVNVFICGGIVKFSMEIFDFDDGDMITIYGTNNQELKIADNGEIYGNIYECKTEMGDVILEFWN